jgi:ABC-type glutathione transport system ATPase component
VAAELPIEDGDWRIGVVVGGSGSGQSSIARAIWPGLRPLRAAVAGRKPIIDAIAPRGAFDDVTAALSAVGLGNVPTWLRPFRVLSNGEQFRANLARVICERPARVKLDKFTTRSTGRSPGSARWRSPRHGGGPPGRRLLVSTCHRDVIEWAEP